MAIRQESSAASFASSASNEKMSTLVSTSYLPRPTQAIGKPATP